jgi:cysteine desulfurase family protein (TIGR01976 family)
MTLNPADIRPQFPALERMIGDTTAAYLDGPGGTQVHQSVIDAMAGFMERGGSNLHGPFVTSNETDEIVADARRAVADLLGCDPHEVVFGQNMTSLTYAFSRALARTWAEGANVVVTRLDHDANVAPWLQAAESVGAEVRFIDFDPDRACALNQTSMEAALDERTELVAFTAASNAIGTLTDARSLVDAAHAVGALTYIDAVHFTPHRSVDVADLGTDFLACSAYKWFGPHIGVVFGKSKHLDGIQPFKLRPSSDESPERWETGTQSFESLAGVAAAIDYMASQGTGETRRERIVSAFEATVAYEQMISARFLAGIAEMPAVTLFGSTSVEDRTPTFAIDVKGIDPEEVSIRLGEQGMFVWSGDYYAWEVMRRLGKPKGLVRIGFVHYNTLAEVDRVLNALADL